jgi:uncharacterized membrane protein YuzA (DUF378 family)
MKLDTLGWIAVVLVIIGAINWGLVGVFQWDLVNAIFGSVSWLLRTVYTLVGIAGLYMIYAVVGGGKGGEV